MDEDNDSFCGFTDDSESSCCSGHGTESCNSCGEYVPPGTMEKMRGAADEQSSSSEEESSDDEEPVSVPNKLTNGYRKCEESDSDSEDGDDEDDGDSESEKDCQQEHEHFLRERPGYRDYFYIYMEGDKSRIPEAVSKWPDLEQACDYDDEKVKLAVSRMIRSQGNSTMQEYERQHKRFLEERPSYRDYFNIYMRGDRRKIPEAVCTWPDIEQACDYDGEKVQFAVNRMIQSRGDNPPSRSSGQKPATRNYGLKKGFLNTEKPASKKPVEKKEPVHKTEAEEKDKTPEIQKQAKKDKTAEIQKQAKKDKTTEIQKQLKQTTIASPGPKRKSRYQSPQARGPPRSRTPPPAEVDPKKKLATLLRKGAQEENDMEALSIFVEARTLVGENNKNKMLDPVQYPSLLFIIAKLLIVRSIEDDGNVKEDLKQVKDILTELVQLTGDEKNFSYVWTRLLKAQLDARWNEHKEVIAECEKMSDELVLDNGTYNKIRYPKSEKFITESGTDNLVKEFESIREGVSAKNPLIDCKAPLWEDEQLPANIHWPHPRSETRTVMFEDDPDREDYVKFICTSNCCIEYHAKCWNKIQKIHQHMKKDAAALKAEEVRDGHFKCLTPECDGYMLRAEVWQYDSVSKQYILIDKGKAKAVKRSDKRRHHEKLPKQRGMNKKFHPAPRPLVNQTENLSGRISPSSSQGSLQENEKQSFPIDKPQSSNQKRPSPPINPNLQALPLKNEDNDKDLESLLANEDEPKKKAKKKHKTKNIVNVEIVTDLPRRGARSGHRQAAAAAYMDDDDQPGPSNVSSGRSKMRKKAPKRKEDTLDSECVICHDPLDMKNVELDTCKFCQKKVHVECLVQWLKKNPVCPQGYCGMPWYSFIDSAPCNICLEPKLARNDLTTLHCCRNDFHTKCIRKWLTQNSVCPLCKKHTLMKDEYPSLY